ncbi:hypothetical protein IW261DRAFT_1576359 [Armillaria novae-zelandiae]|uniref:Uncharacterized protein n=1 Tax=Armillaria novae-zelandiae TaxID=153914 RepID=A0AA39T3W0_9AGAR|nr:hypothetical protein IW261DRAFT_1576359 [Armillaria novae-zelandiae]
MSKSGWGTCLISNYDHVAFSRIDASLTGAKLNFFDYLRLFAAPPRSTSREVVCTLKKGAQRLLQSSRIYLNTHVSRAWKKYCAAPEDYTAVFRATSEQETALSIWISVRGARILPEFFVPETLESKFHALMYMKRRPAREKPADDNSRLPRSSRIYLNMHVSRARKKYCVAPEDHVSPSCEQCQSRRLQSQHLWSIRTCLRCLTIRRTLLDVEYMDQRPGSKHSAQVLRNPTLVE